jgi:hypothetical protein
MFKVFVLRSEYVFDKSATFARDLQNVPRNHFINALVHVSAPESHRKRSLFDDLFREHFRQIDKHEHNTGVRPLQEVSQSQLGEED